MLKPPQFDPEEQRRDAQRLISRLFGEGDEGDGDEGPYQVIRELGRGGMGVVHLAFDQDLHRHVAIKAVRDPGNRELLRRLVDEARAMAKVEHPNVCRVYALAHDQDDVAIVMEYVDGQTLRAWLDEQPHAEAEILAVFRDAGEGLAAIHAKGLVHRDFKPTNVMVDRQGRVLVMDLGLACRDPAHDETRFADDDLLEPEPIAGTPAYMAPEQRRGGLATARSDQYAFCVALGDALPSPRSAWLGPILERGRQRKPNQRFASMRALLDRLAVGADAANQSRVTLKVTLSCNYAEFDENERARIQELLRLVTRDPFLCVENVVAGSVVLEVDVSLREAASLVGKHPAGTLHPDLRVDLEVTHLRDPDTSDKNTASVSAWTNGDIYVVLGPRGLSVHHDDHAELVLPLSQLGGDLPPRARILQSRPLTVHPNANVAFTVDHERWLLRATLEPGGRARRYPWQIAVVANVDPTNPERVLAAYVTGTKARAVTSVVWGVPPADPKLAWERSFEADRPTKVDWPDNLIWDKAIWSRKTRWTTDLELLELDVNRYGYVLTDTDSAVVGLLRPDPSAFACVLRTPKDKDSTVAATATATGVIVATAMPSLGRGVLCHFDEKGGLERKRELEARELGPITIVDDVVVCVVDRRAVLILAAADLELRARIELPRPLTDSQLCLRGAAKRAFVLAGAGHVLIGRQAQAGWSITELDLGRVPIASAAHETTISAVEIEAPPAVEASAAAPIDMGLRIIGQAPALGLDPHTSNDAWHFRQGQPFVIEIKAVSIGGVSETGLFVEVSGEAIEKRLLEPLRAEVIGASEARAEFGAGAKKRVALLDDFRLPAGIVPPKDKKIKPLERFAENPPDTFVTIRLHARPLALGNAILYVRVGFDRVGTGALMRGRPVIISERGTPIPE